MEVRERLQRRIQPFVLRRLKTEVAQGSAAEDRDRRLLRDGAGPGGALPRGARGEPAQGLRHASRRWASSARRVSILAALMRLRQVCCDPRLLKLPPGHARCRRRRSWSASASWSTTWSPRATARWSSASSPRCCELLKAQADEQKLDVPVPRRAHQGPHGAGGRSSTRPDGPPLFFISLKAGGTGLNLTAADYVIHYDPWWNPAVEDQATDRTHRIGQTRAVISYKLITRGTVEEKILALQQRKRELAAGRARHRRRASAEPHRAGHRDPVRRGLRHRGSEAAVPPGPHARRDLKI